MTDHVKSACSYCSGYGTVHDDLGNEIPCVHCEGTGIEWIEDEQFADDLPDDELPDVLPTDK